MCAFHHKKVDKKANEHLYPAIDLFQWKSAAEKNLRSKIDGLDQLTEQRLEDMLTQAALNTKQEIDNAIDSLRGISQGAADILETLMATINNHYLDADTVAMLDAASLRLGDLESNATLLAAAAHQLGDLESNAASFSATSDRLDEMLNNLHRFEQSTAPNWLDTFRWQYQAIIDTKPDVSDVVSTIEHAGQQVADRIQRTAASLDLGETVMVDDAQRWRFFAGGAITVLVVAIITAILTTLAAKGLL